MKGNRRKSTPDNNCIFWLITLFSTREIVENDVISWNVRFLSGVTILLFTLIFKNIIADCRVSLKQTKSIYP